MAKKTIVFHSRVYVPMTDKKMQEIARGNIERHLGDIVDMNEDSPDCIYDEAYTLGFDALADQGIDHEAARRIADQEARSLVQLHAHLDATVRGST